MSVRQNFQLPFALTKVVSEAWQRKRRELAAPWNSSGPLSWRLGGTRDKVYNGFRHDIRCFLQER